MSSTFLRGLYVSSAIVMAFAAPSFAQDQTFTLTVTDSDQPYQTPGYTFRVIPITVTNPSAFRVDSIAFSATGPGTIGIVDFIIFTQGATIPSGAGVSYSTHASDPNAAGFFFDGNPNGVDSNFVLGIGPAGPLTAGEYQLVIAPYDSAGNAGDITVTFDLYGVFSALFVTPPPPPVVNELEEFLAATGGAARLLVVDANGVVRKVGNVSMAARDAQEREALRGGGTITSSSKGTTGLVGNVYTWAEISGFRLAEKDTGSAVINGAGLAVGADVEIGPDMVAGLSLGYSDIDAAETGFTQSGAYTYLQPYFAYRSGAWSGNASLLYGWGDYTQTSIAGTGDADVELTAVSFEGGYDISAGANLTVTPTIGLLYGRETSVGTNGTLAAVSGVSEFTQASLGAILSTSGATGTLSVGAHLDWLEQDGSLALASQFVAEDGVTGRIEVGGEANIGRGMTVMGSLELGGIGGNTESVYGGINFAIRF